MGKQILLVQILGLNYSVTDPYPSIKPLNFTLLFKCLAILNIQGNFT